MIDLKSTGSLLWCLCLLASQPIAAATTDLSSSPSAANQAHAPSFTTHFPQATVTAERLENALSELDKLARKQADEKVVPGLAVAVVYKDKVVFAKGYGVRSTAKNEAVDADTVFQLASVSKSLAATVVAELVGEGKINWDSKISDLDPTFCMHEPWVTSQITIRDLFAHRSGLPDHAGDTLEDIGYDRAQVLSRLRYQMPATSFRSGYAYTNFGLTEGGVAASKAYGLSWEEASAAKLYQPLGMTSTSSRYSDFVARPNKAALHVLIDGKWTERFHRDPDAQSPAGGASASVNDLAKWMLLQLANGKFEGKQIVASAPLEETHHPHMLTHFSPVNGLPDFYGLGFNVSYDLEGRLHLSHSGAFASGGATNFCLVPQESLGVCVLTNAYPIGVAEGLAQTFSDLALYGKPSQDWLALFKQIFSDPASLGMTPSADYNRPPSSPSTALANAAYVGRYTNDLAGDVEISETNGALTIALGPKKRSFPMQHYNRDIFTFVLDSENSTGPTGLIFRVGADGKAASVVVECLNEQGQGWFARARD